MPAFRVSRSVTIDADPAAVATHILRLRAWQEWSPWEDLDPALNRTYEGPESGVGSRYSWVGNRKAGQGSMEITAATPERIEIALTFLKPFKADNTVIFTLTGTSTGTSSTEVEWAMSGEQRGIAALIGRLIPMDKMVGKDFEKGLARLKSVAETGPA